MKTFEYQSADYDGLTVHANFLKRTEGSLDQRCSKPLATKAGNFAVRSRHRRTMRFSFQGL